MSGCGGNGWGGGCWSSGGSLTASVLWAVGTDFADQCSDLTDWAGVTIVLALEHWATLTIHITSEFRNELLVHLANASSVGIDTLTITAGYLLWLA